MNAPSQDEAPPESRLKALTGLLSGLPPHFRFVGVAILVIGGVFSAQQDRAAVAGIAFLVATALVYDWVRSRDTVPSRPSADLRPVPGEPLTVGVLSFVEEGAEGQHEALGDGFAEELITRLDRLDGLSVRPPHAMLKYKGQKADEVARELGAHLVVDGTLRKEGDRYLVEARIIQAWDLGRWAPEQWERPTAEMFELQTEVAVSLGERLMKVSRGGGGQALSRAERAELGRNPADTVGANVIYMEGRTAMRRFNRRRDPEDFRSAEENFRRALELEEDYLDPRAQLAFLYLLKWETDGGPDWLERSAREFRGVRDREPDHPMADAELGYIALVSGRLDEAKELVERAARTHPTATIPQNVLALAYMYLGFYESAVHLTENVIVRLDPDYVYPPTNASTCCYLMGECREALNWAERAEERGPSAFIVPLVEGAAWFCRGERRAAARAWRRGMRVAPTHLKSLFQVTRAWIHADREDLTAARAAVLDYRDERWITGAYGPYFISLCALAGEHDLAVDLIGLQRTWASSYRYLIGDPTLKTLRAHSGFRELLQARYPEWEELCRRDWDLPKPPPELPRPGEFLEGSA